MLQSDAGVKTKLSKDGRRKAQLSKDGKTKSKLSKGGKTKSKLSKGGKTKSKLSKGGATLALRRHHRATRVAPPKLFGGATYAWVGGLIIDTCCAIFQHTWLEYNYKYKK